MAWNQSTQKPEAEEGPVLLLLSLLLLLLHSKLQTPTGRARCQKPEGPSREDSPVRKEKILERKQNYDKTKQQQQKV